MYPPQELDAIDLLQRAGKFLEHYLSDREETITAHERKLARLQAQCLEGALRSERVQKFSSQFFKNRQRVNALAMTALDRAIELGDEKVADLALAIIGDEYSKDFFGMMNKVGGIV